MKLRFFGELKIVVGDTLLEHSWNLFKDLTKILLKLRSERIKKLFDFEFDFLPVYFFKILVDLSIDTTNHLLKICYPGLELIELFKNILQFDINQILDKPFLHVLHRFSSCLELNRWMDSCPFDLIGLITR